MSDLKLVAPDQPTPLEHQLLEAAANEAPSAEQRLRVRAALGLSAVPVPAPAVAKAGRTAALGKVAIGSAIAGSMIIALLFSGVGRKSAPTPRALTPTPTALEPSTTLAAASAGVAISAISAPTEAPVSALPSVAGAGEPPSADAPKATPKGGFRSSAPADSSADLSEQLRLIDAARSAVATGNASAAAQALSSYGAKFPRGSFGQEAAVLHIETLDLQGNHAQASALAARFIAQHPTSPHVSLVQRIADRRP